METALPRNPISTATDSLFVLTGPTSGLGWALWDLLLLQGAPVLALGRRIDRLSGTGAGLIESDFSTSEHQSWLAPLEALLDKLLDQYPERKLVFLNNAGTIAPIGPATDIDTAALQQAMQVNCQAPLALAGFLVKATAQRRRKLRIANITTGAANRPIAGWLAYCTSKAACRMALDTLALENRDVELVHIDPGVIDTGMQAYIREQSGTDRPIALKTPTDAAKDVLAMALADPASIS